jgi:hypothetical protein
MKIDESRLLRNLSKITLNLSGILRDLFFKFDKKSCDVAKDAEILEEIV